MFQNPMQLIQMVQNSRNPLAIMQNMFGNNPIFQKALQMGQGKNEMEIQQIIRNVAQSKGMSNNDLANFISRFGLRF